MKKSQTIFKTFNPVLILNWKTGSLRLTKKKPKSLGPWEIPVQIDLKVNIPIIPEIIAKGEVTIPDVKVKEMMIEAI